MVIKAVFVQQNLRVELHDITTTVFNIKYLTLLFTCMHCVVMYSASVEPSFQVTLCSCVVTTYFTTCTGV